MKKKLLFLFFIVLASVSSNYACAICGCGAGNYYFGILPQYQKNFIGLRYLGYSFTSHIGAGYNPYEATRETFQTTELWMRFYPVKRLQVVALIDYNFNTQRDRGVITELHGLGDIPVLINYNIINTAEQPLSDARVLNHNLFIGGGVKLPTGKYKFQEDPNQVSNPNFQLGTGSVDFIVSSMYTLRFERFGLSVDGNYKINTTNANGYQFGNRLSGTASLFYIQQIKKFGLMPNIGVYLENAERNRQHGVTITETGGDAYFFSVGLETYYKKISVGFNLQSPIVQHLANGHSKAHEKVMAHITFLF
jgi:hypothetical protein